MVDVVYFTSRTYSHGIPSPALSQPGIRTLPFPAWYQTPSLHGTQTLPFPAWYPDTKPAWYPDTALASLVPRNASTARILVSWQIDTVEVSNFLPSHHLSRKMLLLCDQC